MSNTLTGLIPTMYEALDKVSREMVGFIPAVRKDASAAQAGKDQPVRIPIVPANAAEDIVPGVNPADSGDVSVDYTDVIISKSRAVPIRWNGEEQKSLSNGNSPMVGSIMGDQFAQAFRTLANEMESDLAGLYKYASRAYGTAGTTPFATAGQLDDVAEVKKILQDNGAPTGELKMVIDTGAGAKLGGMQSTLFKVNEAGSSDLLRNGNIGMLEGFSMGISGQVAKHTSGTAASATTDNSGYSVGATSLTLASAGTGTILAGDVLKFADDDSLYVCNTGDADVSNGGTIVLNKPGLTLDMATATKAITTPADYKANMAFDKNAIVLVSRAPALPTYGDSAIDRTYVTDPVSGLTFEVSVYTQYKQVKIEVAIAWGVKLIKPEHVALLLG